MGGHRHPSAFVVVATLKPSFCAQKQSSKDEMKKLTYRAYPGRRRPGTGGPSVVGASAASTGPAGVVLVSAE